MMRISHQQASLSYSLPHFSLTLGRESGVKQMIRIVPRKFRIGIVFVLGLILSQSVVGGTVWAAPVTKAVSALTHLSVTLLPESKLEVKGGSTIHPFEITAMKIGVVADIDPAAAVPYPKDSAKAIGAALQAGTVKRFEFSVPVATLKSGNGGLDDNMHKTLKGDAFPVIQFKLVKYQAQAAAPEGKSFPIKATGRLTIAGHEKEIEMNLTGSIVPGGLRVRGSENILMTDYGIEPPSMMLGAIRVDNRVEVQFDLALALQATK